MRFLALALILMSWSGFGVCFADAGASLQQQIEAVEQLDARIAQTTQELKVAKTPPERHRIEGRLQELKAKQEILLKELEKQIGPLPPAVQSEGPIPLEEQLRLKQQRHEAILDSETQRRNLSK